MVIVRRVEPYGLGAEAGLAAKDGIRRVNGREIRDALDFQFHAAEPWLVVEVERDGQVYSVELAREPGVEWGLEFEDMRVRECVNRCVFCFVDQMPPGMRRSLYVRDDDFRLSFLHGSYVTLTNVTRGDMERIATQRLSPLYVSVHATEPAVRQRLMGRVRPREDILDRIRELADHGIEMHTQIVLCPGWNDGAHLEQTVEDLAGSHPAVRSIGLVPVGLARFRHGLPPLRPVTRKDAVRYVDFAARRGEQFAREMGKRLVYCADELYLLSGYRIPPKEYYDGFPQLENGIGMARVLLDKWAAGRGMLSDDYSIAGGRRVGLVTGELAAPLVEGLLSQGYGLSPLSVELIPVRNTFFGPSVTVSGLLTGGDIIRTVSRRPDLGMVLLPPNCVNEEGLLLDDLTVDEVAERLQADVRVGTYDLASSLYACLGMERQVGQGETLPPGPGHPSLEPTE